MERITKTEEDWLKWHEKLKEKPNRRRASALGPESTRQLFLAALRCSRPGCHALNVTGDIKQESFDHSAAKMLLGWEPHLG